MMETVKYVGPHDGVDIEDAATGFRGSVERGGTIEVPAEVAQRLVEQGWEKVGEKPSRRARDDKE